MPWSKPTGRAGSAEKSFRDAFQRLKRARPARLPKDARVTQNNVAKEAGCDASALKKSRYPSLVAEIQRWVKEHAEAKSESSRQKMLAHRRRNRSLREEIQALKAQRDYAASLLMEADAKILHLTMENARLLALQPRSNVTSMRKASPATEARR